MTSRGAEADRLTFAIGDIHGCSAALHRLLGLCRDYAESSPCRFVFIGDYIDRGPDSAGAIRTIRALDDTVCLMGNHEALLLEALETGDPSNWLRNGGDRTLESYGVDRPEALPQADLTWIGALRPCFDDGLRFFVHAGIAPGIPLDQQDHEALMWIREPFLSSTMDHGRLIVHGHTPQRSGLPEMLANRVNIDTGCVYGGTLTAAVFLRKVREPIAFLSVSQN